MMVALFTAGGIIVDNDVPDAVERIRSVKVYPWSDRDNPKPNRFVSICVFLFVTGLTTVTVVRSASSFAPSRSTN